MSRARSLVFLATLVLILDQLTKYWAEHILGPYGRVEILPIFDFSLAHNYGAAFGFLNDAGGWQTVFFTSLAVIVSIVLVVMIRQLQSHERHLSIAYTLIIAGALGNAVDRLLYGYVVDFIHVYYGDSHYPHFNIADSAIFIGAMLLIIDAFGKPFLNTAITDLSKSNTKKSTNGKLS